MNWVVENLPLIGQRTLEHLALSVPPIILSFIISVPIGWLANRYHWSRGVLLTVLGLLYAIPSLPLFVILPIVLGTGLRDSVNVIVALTLYGIALMVRTTADALGSVSSDVIQSATAIGFSPWTRFWRVDLPLAGPVLLAGIRVVAVSTVSLVTVGAVLGIKSLGLLFTDGLQRNIVAEVAAGMVATIALALAIDFALVLVGRVLMPWTRATRVTVERRSRVAAGVVAP
ncbi:ABC transporter permease [Agreia sp. COWG]|uniref:ABC transporter permease n=1 Tax=Agreia sp. COWG TaxID=2773266 RepID=UPI0019286707|nr:ABC transporter permease [Agreia sp. COWG]CAD5996517.1 Osmoprotectant transport system permease protein [Agreia sp. COWG]